MYNVYNPRRKEEKKRRKKGGGVGVVIIMRERELCCVSGFYLFNASGAPGGRGEEGRIMATGAAESAPLSPQHNRSIYIDRGPMETSFYPV